jgi:anti-sigma factor RsiW
MGIKNYSCRTGKRDWGINFNESRYLYLLDVPSTDQHTVKPWFDGKLKFSPPVYDFAERGFRLTGGRLDYFNGREVAALIYQRNKHIINLFIWPSESGRNTAAESFTKDGYNVSHWERAATLKNTA